MIRFFKWFNHKVETSNLWFVGYCFILRIVLGKFYSSLSDQSMYAVCMIIGIVLSFIALKLILRLYEERLKYYSVFQSGLSTTYIIITPITMLYFLTYHPFLGASLWMGWSVIIGIVYNICNNSAKKKQA